MQPTHLFLSWLLPKLKEALSSLHLDPLDNSQVLSTTTTTCLQQPPLGYILALGICAAQRRTDPEKRLIQALETGFIHLSRKGQEPVYLEHGLEGSREWGLGMYDVLT